MTPTRRFLTLQLAVGLVSLAAIAAFVVIARDIVSEGEIVRFDHTFSHALRSTTTPGWERFFSIVTWFGSREVLFVGSLIVTIVVFTHYGVVLAAWWVAGQLGGALLNLALKHSFARTRPEYADALLAASSWSFPSAHAMNTLVFCGLGAYLLVRGGRSWKVASLAVTLAIVWCLVMSFSRIYLGVHFASDVVAGLMAGTAWVALCVSAMESLRSPWRSRTNL